MEKHQFQFYAGGGEAPSQHSHYLPNGFWKTMGTSAHLDMPPAASQTLGAHENIIFSQFDTGVTPLQPSPAPCSAHRGASGPVSTQDSDADFPPAHAILRNVATPAVKIAGSRHAKRKEDSSDLARKGKRRATVQAGPSNMKKYRGHTSGAPNYTPEDIGGLLEILEVCLPLGAKGWKSVEDEFRQRAEENARPDRTAKSLELKFKQLAKTKKPTGDGEMPKYITRAHEIEDAMSEKAGTRDLDDEDLVDEAIKISSDDEDGGADDEQSAVKVPARLKKPTPVTVKTESKEPSLTPVTRRALSNRLTPAPRTSRSRVSSTLLANLTTALDTEMQATRAEECSARSIQTAQLFGLNSQLREAQQLIESLRTQLADAERKHSDAERRADKMEIMAMIKATHQPSFETPRRPHTPSQTPRRSCTPSRQVRHDIYYKDGGRAVRWVHPNDTPYVDSPSTRVLAHEDNPASTWVPQPSTPPSPLSGVAPPPPPLSLQSLAVVAASQQPCGITLTLTPTRCA